MVAITVAIAATVYVYVSGMLSPTPKTAPNITGTIETKNQNITISLAGDTLSADDARITITDSGDNVRINNSVDEGSAWDIDAAGGNTESFKWVDANGDDKIGSGDTLKVYDDDGGLSVGSWYVKVIQKSTGKAAYDSSEIEIEA
jgi:FlaG/FlaF family flagellin (archaellin)